jgi:hypothetical protein
MNKAADLWIDHRKAVIVVVTDKGEEIKLIISKVEKQPGRFGAVRSMTSYESQQVPADDSHEREFMGHPNIYYYSVVACIRDAESILIFGPGEAKGELKKRIERNKLGERIATV